MKNFTIAVFFGCCAAIGGELAVDQLSLPVVSIDAGTGECVRVESPSGDLPCSAIPARHVSQWVYRSPAVDYRNPPSFDVAANQ